jgi:Polysaccharide deacetylase
MAASFAQNYAVSGPNAQTIKTCSDSTNVTHANSGTAASVSYDDASALGISGSRLHVSAPAGNTYHETTIASGWSVANWPLTDQVCVRIYLPDVTKVAQVQVMYGTSSFAHISTTTYNLNNGIANLFSGWHTIFGGADNAGSDTVVAGDTVNAVKVRVFASGGQAYEYWVDTFKVANYSRPKLVLTYDDADDGWYDYAKPTLLTYGIRATFGVATHLIGTNASLYLTQSELLALRDDGHDIYSHNNSNNTISTLGVDAYLSAYDAGVSYLRSIGISNEFIYHPWVQGLHTDAGINGLIRRGVKLARSAGTVYPLQHVGNGLDNKIFAIDGRSLSAATTLNTWKASVDNAIKYRKTMFSICHDIVASGASGSTQIDDADHTAAIAYAVGKMKQGLIDIVPVSEWYRGLTQPALVA